MWKYNYSPCDGNDFLAHAGEKSYKGHKFIRKYRGPSGKWVYVYKDKADQHSTAARIEVTKGKKNKKSIEYITQHFTNENGQRDIVSRTKVTHITKASKSKKKNGNKKHQSSLTGFKKGSAKTKKAIQKAFRQADKEDRKKAGNAAAKSISKAVGKNTKSITKIGKKKKSNK